MDVISPEDDSEREDRESPTALTLPIPEADAMEQRAESSVADASFRLDVENIPADFRGRDRYAVTYDDMTPIAREVYNDSDVVARYMSRNAAASEELWAERNRVITGQMETTLNVALITPDSVKDMDALAEQAGMDVEEVKYWNYKDPQYLANQVTIEQVKKYSGHEGYTTRRMRSGDGAEQMRQDWVDGAQLEADYVAIFGSSFDRARFDLGVGFGQVGVFGANVARGIIRGVSDIASVDWNIDGRPGGANPAAVAASRVNMERILSATTDFAKDAEAKWLAPEIDTGNSTTDWIRSAVFRGTPFLLGSVALSLIPGVGTSGAAAVIGTGMGFETYGDLRNEGVSPLLAAMASGGTAITSYYLNTFQLNRWTRNLSGRSPFRRFSVGAAIETTEELLSETGESLGQGVAEATAKLVGLPDYDRDQWWREVKESAAGAFQEGAAAGFLSMVTRIPGAPGAVRAQARAHVFNDRFKKTVNRIGEMQLYEKKQDAVIAGHLNQTAKHHGGAGIVFASIQDLQQTGLTKKELLDGLGVTEGEYDYARTLNVDLAILYGNAAVFAKRQLDAGNDLFQNILRADPDAMTGREIIEQQREATAVLELAEVNFKAMEDAGNAAVPERIKIFRAGLRAAGYDVNEADAGAALFWSRAQRAAEQWGVTPEEWLERRDVQLEMDAMAPADSPLLADTREGRHYREMVTQFRARRDAAAGYVSPDVAVANETGQDIFAAPSTEIPQATAAQGDVAALMQDAVSDGDNMAWAEEAAGNYLAEFGIDGNEAAPLVEGVRDAILAGMANPDVRQIAGQLGVTLPSDARRDSMTKKIREIVNRAATESQADFAEVVLEEQIAERDVKRIRDKTGLDLSGFKRTMDNYGIIHALRRHGPGNEKGADQEPIAIEDFDRIPDVVANPDDISRRKRKGTADTITYTKDIGGVVYVVEEVRTKAKKLAFKSMYKKREGDWQNLKAGQNQASVRSESPSQVTDVEVEKASPLDRGLSEDGLSAQDVSTQQGDAIHNNSLPVLPGDVKPSGTVLDTLYQENNPGDNRGRILFPTYFQERYGGDARNIQWAPNVVNLFSKADISTVVHELNHLFIRDLENMVAAGRGGEQARADLAALTEFAGGRLDRAGYEKIAEAWERYAMDGTAPSLELHDAFEAFRKYIGRAYAHARQTLNVEPSTAVRAVFDRFLATDRQIEAARAMQNQAGYWYDVATNLDEKAKQRLRAARQRMDEAKRRAGDTRQGGKAMRRLANLNADRAAVRGEAANPPAYRAVETARKAGGFDRNQVIAQIGKEGAAEIARRHGDGMFGAGAVLDDVAESSGYLNVREMLADLARIDPIEESAAKSVDEELAAEEELDGQREMEEGESVSEEVVDIEEEALVEQIEESIRAEGGGAKRLQEFRIRYKAMKTAAERLIGPKALREATDIRPFQKAKRDANRKAMEASSRNDQVKVTEYLNLELMHHITLRECGRARELRERFLRRYGTRALLKALEEKEHSARISNDCAEAIKAVVTFVGLTNNRKLRPQNEGDVIPFPTYEADSNVAGFLPDIAFSVDPWLLNKVYPQGYQDYRDFSVDQLREVDRVLQMLLKQGRGELDAMRDLGARTLDELVVKSIQPMARRKNIDKQHNDRTLWGRFLNKANRFLISITLPENWFMAMDGNPTIRGEEAGVNQQAFWKMRDCQLVKDQLYKDMIAKIQPHLDVLEQARHDLTKRFGSKWIVLPGVNFPDIMKNGHGYHAFDVDMLLSIAMQMGNDASFYRLTGILKGQAEVDYREGCFNFTEEELAKIAQLFTADQWRAIQGIWDGVGSLYGQLDAVTYRITNRHMVKEPAMAITVTTAEGEVLPLKGGYFPLVNDPMLSDRAAGLSERSNIEDAINAGIMDNIHQSSKPAAGMIKERLRDENGNPVVRLPQILKTDILIRHLDAATHYISHAETILEFDRLTRDESWRKAYVDKFGAAQYQAIRKWVQDLARPNKLDNSAGAQFMEQMRSLATINALGLRFTTGLKQRQGYFQAINFMTDSSRTKSSGLKWMKRGWREMGFMGNLLGRNKEKVDWVNEVSAYMRARQGAHDRELRAQLERLNPLATEVRIPGTNISLNKRKVHDGMFAWIQANDTAAAYAAWLAGYHQAMAGEANFDPTGMSNEEIQKKAVRYADSVAATQASSFAADLTEIQRDAGFLRFLSMFMSGNVRQGSRLSQYIDAHGLGDKSKADIGLLVFREFVAPALTYVFMAAALKSMLGDDEDDLFTDAAWEVAETTLAPFPLVREVSSGLRYRSSGNVPALAKPLEALYKGSRGVDELFSGEFGKAIYDMADAVGFVVGVPAVNIVKDAKPLTDAAGITEPRRR